MSRKQSRARKRAVKDSDESPVSAEEPPQKKRRSDQGEFKNMVQYSRISNRARRDCAFTHLVAPYPKEFDKYKKPTQVQEYVQAHCPSPSELWEPVGPEEPFLMTIDRDDLNPEATFATRILAMRPPERISTKTQVLLQVLHLTLGWMGAKAHVGSTTRGTAPILHLGIWKKSVATPRLTLDTMQESMNALQARIQHDRSWLRDCRTRGQLQKVEDELWARLWDSGSLQSHPDLSVEDQARRAKRRQDIRHQEVLHLIDVFLAVMRSCFKMVEHYIGMHDPKHDKSLEPHHTFLQTQMEDVLKERPYTDLGPYFPSLAVKRGESPHAHVDSDLKGSLSLLFTCGPSHGRGWEGAEVMLPTQKYKFSLRPGTFLFVNTRLLPHHTTRTTPPTHPNFSYPPAFLKRDHVNLRFSVAAFYCGALAANTCHVLEHETTVPLARHQT
ncbi:hypothetical protein FRB99_006530 [Tulasnella sp. 403]|nr:hypothetical protein FRB99_006530 [Tulasnella sp. 403]